MTVRRAIGMLLDQGAVSTTRGRGTFVQPLRLATATFDLSEFHDILAEPGVTAKVVEARVLPAGPRAAANLGVADGTHVVSIRRILQRGDEPLIYHRESLIYDPTRPTDRVRARRHRPARHVRGRRRAAAPSAASSSCTPPRSREEEASRLALPPGGAAWVLEHIFYGYDEKPISWGCFICRGDLFSFRASVGRAGARWRHRREEEPPMTEFEGLDPASLAARIAALDEQGALDAVAGAHRRRRRPSGDHRGVPARHALGRGALPVRQVLHLRPHHGRRDLPRGHGRPRARCFPRRPRTPARARVLICTVRGDIHDLGKNIVIMMLRSYGIVVHDLGVDVSPDEVVRKAVELQPDIVGLSGLLTVATDGMKATVEAVRDGAAQIGRRLPVIIGGGIVDEQTCAWTGADLWANDASRGVRLIRETIAAARG